MWKNLFLCEIYFKVQQIKLQLADLNWKKEFLIRKSGATISLFFFKYAPMIKACCPKQPAPPIPLIQAEKTNINFDQYSLWPHRETHFEPLFLSLRAWLELEWSRGERERAGAGWGSLLYGGRAPETWLGPEWSGGGATEVVLRGPFKASKRDTAS